MKQIFDTTPLSGERARLFENFITCSLRADKDISTDIESRRTQKHGGRGVPNYEQTALVFVQSCWELTDTEEAQAILDQIIQDQARQDEAVKAELLAQITAWVRSQIEYLKQYPDLIARYMSASDDRAAVVRLVKDIVTSHSMAASALFGLETGVTSPDERSQWEKRVNLVNSIFDDIPIDVNELSFINTISLSTEVVACNGVNIGNLIQQYRENGKQEPLLQFLRAHFRHMASESDKDVDWKRELFSSPDYILDLLPALLNEQDIELARFMIRGYLAHSDSVDALMGYLVERYQLTTRVDNGRLDRIREGEVLCVMAQTVSAGSKHVAMINRLFQLDIRAAFAYLEGLSDLAYKKLMDHIDQVVISADEAPDNIAIRPYLLLRSCRSYTGAEKFLKEVIQNRWELSCAVFKSCHTHGRTDAKMCARWQRKLKEETPWLEGLIVGRVPNASIFLAYQPYLTSQFEARNIFGEDILPILLKLMQFDPCYEREGLVVRSPSYSFAGEDELEQQAGFDPDEVDFYINHMGDGSLLTDKERKQFDRDLNGITVASTIAVGVTFSAFTTAFAMTITGAVTGVLATAIPVVGVVLLAAALLTCALVLAVHLVKKEKLKNHRKQRLKEAIAKLDPKTGKAKVAHGGASGFGAFARSDESIGKNESDVGPSGASTL